MKEFLDHLIRSLDGLSFKMLHFHSFMTFIDLGYFFCFAVWELRLKDYSELLHSTSFLQNKLCTNDCGCFNTKKGSFLSQLPTYRKEYNWSVNKPREKLPLSDKTGSQSFATIILVNKSLLHRNTFQQVDSLFFGFQQSLSLCRLLRLNRNVMEIDAQVLLILTKLSHHWLVCNFREKIRYWISRYQRFQYLHQRRI